MQAIMQCKNFPAAECSSRQTPPMCQGALICGMRVLGRPRPALCRSRQQKRLEVVATYPTPETDKERSNIDYPQEWITPQPSRRPDIFPEFEKLQTPMPKPMPGDPEMPDEEEEEEKEKKPDKEDPDEDKPKPDEPAPSEE